MSPSVVLIILAMLILNGFFAAYELALASIRTARLRALAEQRRPGAKIALEMKNRMEGSLAVVQLGITLVGAIAAATGGASVDEWFTPTIEQYLGTSHRFSQFIALTCFVVPLSALTIVVGELIPKVLALKNPEWICTALSPLMRAFAVIVYPAVWLLEWLTKTLVRIVERLLPRRKAEDHL